jgi:hypothetical protein
MKAGIFQTQINIPKRLASTRIRTLRLQSQHVSSLTLQYSFPILTPCCGEAAAVCQLGSVLMTVQSAVRNSGGCCMGSCPSQRAFTVRERNRSKSYFSCRKAMNEGVATEYDKNEAMWGQSGFPRTTFTKFWGPPLNRETWQLSRRF